MMMMMKRKIIFYRYNGPFVVSFSVVFNNRVYRTDQKKKVMANVRINIWTSRVSFIKSIKSHTGFDHSDQCQNEEKNKNQNNKQQWLDRFYECIYWMELNKKKQKKVFLVFFCLFVWTMNQPCQWSIVKKWNKTKKHDKMEKRKKTINQMDCMMSASSPLYCDRKSKISNENSLYSSII